MTADPRQSRNVEAGPLYEAGNSTPDTAAFPVDHSREVPAVAALKRRGFTAEFVIDAEMLRIAGSNQRFAPEDVRIRDYYRFEGTSDPDDMSVIYAIETSDGTRGTLTDAFGAYADPAVGAIIGRIPVDPSRAMGGWRSVVLPIAAGALVAIATSAAVAMIARRRAARRRASRGVWNIGH